MLEYKLILYLTMDAPTLQLRAKEGMSEIMMPAPLSFQMMKVLADNDLKWLVLPPTLELWASISLTSKPQLMLSM